MSTPVCYFNGRWIAADEIAISPDDLGFLLGATVTERLRTFAGQPFRVAEHVARLRHSLEVVGWRAERLAAEVEGAIGQFVARNAALIAPGDDWAIVAFVTPGVTYDAAQPTVCVHGFPLRFAGWAHQFAAGVAGVVVDVRQVPGNCWPAELKCRSRMHYYLADQEAARKQPGARAILLDQHGYVCEASTANVVAYFADRGLVTPKLDGVLPGISQQVLFELADGLGMTHGEADLTPEELAAADEAFLTSTSICMLPLVQLDGRPIGTGAAGPVFQNLLQAWSKLVGLDIGGQAVERSTG